MERLGEYEETGEVLPCPLIDPYRGGRAARAE